MQNLKSFLFLIAFNFIHLFGFFLFVFSPIYSILSPESFAEFLYFFLALSVGSLSYIWFYLITFKKISRISFLKEFCGKISEEVFKILGGEK